jgi:hypothetical protein
LVLARPPANKPGAVPVSQRELSSLAGFRRLRNVAGRLAARCLVVGMATPMAAESGASQGLLTSRPEPANLLIMGLALAVLFLFRRFSRTG